MGDYISREDAIKAMLTRYWDGKETLREIMNGVQAADVTPIKRGKWIPDDDLTAKAFGLHICSVCESISFRLENSWGDQYAEELTPYCPYCGARMDEY